MDTVWCQLAEVLFLSPALSCVSLVISQNLSSVSEGMSWAPLFCPQLS